MEESFFSLLERTSKIKLIEYKIEKPYLDQERKYNFSLWKEQDHYLFLSLNKRHLSTPKEIKQAYRKTILLHHPDKSRSKNQKINENNDEKFKCIQKAYEILSNDKKKKQFDSVDPNFDFSIPEDKEPKDFFKVFSNVFERNSRFSKKQPVPQLGKEDETKEKVQKFYSFWFAFESTRTFEYLDKEDVNGNREERRYIEKKNKDDRENNKKKDRRRILDLVDRAFKYDPRIKKIKEKEKMKRKENGKTEQYKNHFLKYVVGEMFFDRTLSHPMFERERELIMIFIKNKSEEELKELTKQLKEIKTLYERRLLYKTKIKNINPIETNKEQTSTENKKEEIKETWTREEIDLLIEAVNIYPGGIKERWLKIKEHISGRLKKEFVCSEKDLIQKAKQILENCSNNKPNDSKWSKEEQALLEEGMKINPQNKFSSNPIERWKRISSHVKTKTTKECFNRARNISIELKTKK